MAADARFTRLLESGRIGRMELRNRIIMAPMGTSYATEEGFVTQRMKDCYEARARGGAALIIPGVLSIDAPRGRCETAQLAISDDKYIPGLRELVDVVHRHGARIAAQLQHAGKIATVDRMQGVQQLSPSETDLYAAEITTDMTGEEIGRLAKRFANAPADQKTKAMSVEEIKHMVDRFAQAAERAKKSGFDGVEIHAGHGYLLSSFLSPASNKRHDAYGGDLKNRARFLLEVIQATRERVAKDFPVWCRIDGREFDNTEGGITIDDAVALAVLLQEAGVDAIHVSAYGGVISGFIDAPICYPPGHLVPYAAAVKAAVKVPVIAVGRISPELGEELLRQGKADFIAMGRALLADPDLPNKLASGREDEIRPCIRCYVCAAQHIEDWPTICSVNVATGREAEFAIKAAAKPKNVAVIGSGPAGMEAARIAALRGHRVTLYERNRRLGGSLVFASVVNADNEGLLDYMTRQMKKLPINIRTGAEVSADSIAAARPDVVIVAVGPNIAPPQIPGSSRRNVITGKDLREMMNGRDISGKLRWWMRMGLPLVRPVLQRIRPSAAAALTRRWMPIGKRVTVIGGDLVAIEVAEFLVQRGREVTVVSGLRSMAPEMALPRRWRVLKDLREHGVIMINRVKYEEITDRGVVIADKKGNRQTIEADTVVLAEGITANPALFQQLQARLPEVYQAGDCADVRLIQGAIEDGARLAIKT
ncbi:MAG: FAD-dependent oxidoreductase [Dehalococcoidia bacterium]|nr:FAD-dependent oxidoreductase [Dehalococcoidia bacterium]